jgi:hypothetical protein
MIIAGSHASGDDETIDGGYFHQVVDRRVESIGSCPFADKQVLSQESRWHGGPYSNILQQLNQAFQPIFGGPEPLYRPTHPPPPPGWQARVTVTELHIQHCLIHQPSFAFSLLMQVVQCPGAHRTFFQNVESRISLSVSKTLYHSAHQTLFPILTLNFFNVHSALWDTSGSFLEATIAKGWIGALACLTSFVGNFASFPDGLSSSEFFPVIAAQLRRPLLDRGVEDVWKERDCVRRTMYRIIGL